MGTISDKLMRIINTKEDIRQALISKGYDVPTSIPFKEYAKMILDLPCKADSFPDIEGIVARYSALGLTNEQMAENPVWVDKTGNGHDLQMKNFLWGGMSGVGGYKLNWGDSSIWANYITQGTFGTGEVTDNTIHITSAKTNNALFETRASLKSVEYKVLIKGLTDDIYLRYGVFNDGKELWTEIKNDGIYTLPSYDYDSRYNMKWKVMSQTYPIDCNITIEQLPLYSGALVFDGVDDYGTCDNFPILTKEKGYTVVALRQWITRGKGALGLVSNVKNWLKDGAFLLEYRNIQADHLNKPISFGAIGSENDLPHILTYQTSKSYNGVSITTGNFEGTDVLHVGKLAPTNVGTCINAAIWELVFLDHDATEEELTKIKDYFVKTYPWLFPYQAWTVVGKTNEDEDRATIANITGNGNNLVLSNFGFAEGSGYGLYAQNYISYAITNRAVYTKTNSSIHVTKSITAGVNFTESARDVTIPSYRIKVTGIQSGQEMIYRGSNNTFLTNIPSDGIYVLPAVENGSNLGFQFVSYTGDCDITIEQIPEYEGYLVTDGVDDRVQDSSFKLNKDWTLVGEWVFLNQKATNAGITKPFSFVVYNRTTGLSLFINTGTSGITIENVKSIKAICSDGRIYFDDWSKMLISKDQDITSSTSVLSIGFNGTAYTQMAFKNLGIYNNQLLSKDDCIKAYNYLQTLKSK